jgi:uncharacterized protein
VIVDLKKCAQRPLRVDDRFDLGNRLAGVPELEELAPIHAVLEVAPVGSGRFLVSGSFEVRGTVLCVRCAEPFAVDLGSSIRLTYLPERERPTAEPGEVSMPLAEVDVSYYQDDRLELLPLLEEQVLLALPMRFLCSPSCRGLCPDCGRNRNLGGCTCPAPGTDPRLEVLRTLLH